MLFNLRIVKNTEIWPRDKIVHVFAILLRSLSTTRIKIQNFMCGRASPIYDSGDSHNEQRISRVRATFSNSSETRTQCGTSRNAVRGTRTRMDPGERRQREEGRKERVACCISHVATHTWNAVCKCVQSDGSILQPVVPALVPLSFLHPPSSFPLASLASSDIPRAYSRARTRRTQHTNAHAHTYTFRSYGGGLQRRLPRRATTAPTASSRASTFNDRSIGRSVGPQTLFRSRRRETRKVMSTAYE